jgi:sensor histidine kinase YesM
MGHYLATGLHVKILYTSSNAMMASDLAQECNGAKNVTVFWNYIFLLSLPPIFWYCGTFWFLMVIIVVVVVVVFIIIYLTVGANQPFPSQ